jgi:hypothetical protein
MLTQEEHRIQTERLKQMYTNAKVILDSNGGDHTDPEFLSVRSAIYEIQNALREDQNEKETAINQAQTTGQARLEEINALLANTEINNS